MADVNWLNWVAHPISEYSDWDNDQLSRELNSIDPNRDALFETVYAIIEGSTYKHISESYLVRELRARGWRNLRTDFFRVNILDLCAYLGFSVIKGVSRMADGHGSYRWWVFIDKPAALMTADMRIRCERALRQTWDAIALDILNASEEPYITGREVAEIVLDANHWEAYGYDEEAVKILRHMTPEQRVSLARATFPAGSNWGY